MRHELLECLVRIATKRYGHKIKDSSDCVTALLENQLIPNMPPDAVDPDVFRRERLYNEPVDAVFRAHADALQVIYEIYSNLHPVEGKAHLGIEEWYQLFTDIGMLVGPLCEITARDLRLAFWQSQPVVDDEVKYRHRVTALSYLDFCEALGRICCVKLGLGDGSEMLEPFELSLQSWLGLYFVPTYKRILKDKAKGVLKKTL